MTWFRVDDGLHAHMKAVRAGVPAMGLWLLAGSWSSNQLTDGWVPDYIASRLDPDFREHAAALVRAGLWVEEELDGDKGWRFHQWDEHQPSSESVLAKREAARERMRRVREQRGTGSQDVRANVRENFAGSAPNPDPTRPDPTHIQPPAEVADEVALFEQPEPRTKSRAKPKQPVGDPTETQRAFGLARLWVDFREKQGTPIVVAGKGENLDLHKLRNLIEPFLKKGYSDDEVKRGLVATDEGIPSTASLDRALTRLRNQQNGRMSGGMTSNAHQPYRNPEDHSVYDDWTAR